MVGLQRGFENVDKNPDQIAFFQFLDLAANQQSVLESRERMVELCAVELGDYVLDVGCGLGHEARRLAQLVGDGGRVVGLDVSAAFVEEARKRSKDMHLAPEFVTGDAVELKFDDGIFDVCRSERVLLYVSDPALAIAEMARVTKPAGKVIVHDFDHDGFFIDSNLPVLTRKIESLMRRAPKNPSLSHELPYLMRQAGLKVDIIEPAPMWPTLPVARHLYGGLLTTAVADGEMTEKEIEAWWQDQETMHETGQFSHINPGYLIVATKP